MDDWAAAQFCFAMAEFVRVLGMQAENAQRAAANRPPVYVEKDFQESAFQIEEYGRHILQRS